jgi:hypothetical protein
MVSGIRTSVRAVDDVTEPQRENGCKWRFILASHADFDRYSLAVK